MLVEHNVKCNSPKAWLLAARPKTLAGAAVPVMIGLALAYTDTTLYEYDNFNWTAALLCFLFAMIMQIDANFVNDFFDYSKGTDDAEKRLGPRRACAQGWVSIDKMKHAIALTTCLACLVGLPLVLFGGLEMILIGLFCVVFCFLYTTHLSYVGLGDLLVLVFFGIVPVCTIYYIQFHTITSTVFWASVACGTVIDALLIVNNFRDRDTDREAGKNTIVVRIGAQNSLFLYLGTGWCAYLIGIIFWFDGHVLAFLLPTIYVVLHTFTYLKIKRINKGKALNLCLGDTARNIFIYGLLVSLGLLI
ncbi:MAG: 1,4-dihydroxy-2-naphthoate octaprenyltransferase [Prevotella sp.]